MLKTIARICFAACLGLGWLMPVTIVQAAGAKISGRTVIDDALNDGVYDNMSKNLIVINNGVMQSGGMQRTGGLRVASNTSNFSVDAHGICRYIDVTTAPNGGILIPFDSPAEWIGSGNGFNNKGFIATNNQRSFIKLDFCRRRKDFGSIDFGDVNGISIYQPTNDPVVAAGNARTTIDMARTQAVEPAPQVRINTFNDDTFAASLVYKPTPKTFSLSRQDCLGNTTYPDGSVSNPCFSWSWRETIAATFTDNIGLDRKGAVATASGLPVTDGNSAWTHSIVRTTCAGPDGASNESPPRPLPGATCPPAVQPPVLGNCKAEAHNTRQTRVFSFNNTRVIHTCTAGNVETASGSYTYDLQGEFWCFDGTVYPPKPGTETEVNPRTMPSTCAPIINGKVGPADRTSVDSLASAGPNDPNLCTRGTVDAFTTTATGWSWTCKGINGGGDAFGTADKHQAYNLACNAADNSLNGISGNGAVSFSCDKFNTGNSTCASTPSVTGGVNTCCKTGQPNNQSFNVLGSTVNGCDAPSGTCTPSSGNRCNGNFVGFLSSADNDKSTSCRNTGGNCIEEHFHYESEYGGNPTQGTDYGCFANVTNLDGQSINQDGSGNYETWSATLICSGNQTCTQSIETETTPCGSGFTGNQTRTRTKDTGNVCGIYGNYSSYDRSQCISGCTAHPENQTVPCGAGYTGNKIQRRTADQGNACNNNSAWADFDTSACVPDEPSVPNCPSPSDPAIQKASSNDCAAAGYTQSYTVQCAYLSPAPNGTCYYTIFAQDTKYPACNGGAGGGANYNIIYKKPSC